jgi:hypothetical protein
VRIVHLISCESLILLLFTPAGPGSISGSNPAASGIQAVRMKFRREESP